MIKKKVNPRINKEVDALPPGILWWVSRCSKVPNVTFTFCRDDTLTWFTANRHAEIFWREYVTSLYTSDMHRQAAQLIESEVLATIQKQQTTLWE